MNAAPDGDAGARREGRRIAHTIVIVVAVAFIGASAFQIIPAVFGIGVRPVAANGSDPVETQCAIGVRSLALALDRAGAMSWSPSPAAGGPFDLDSEKAHQAFERGLAPEWNSEAQIEQSCAKSSAGLDAWAALMRLRRAEEQLVLHGLLELVPLERDVTAHLPANLR